MNAHESPILNALIGTTVKAYFTDGEQKTGILKRSKFTPGAYAIGDYVFRKTHLSEITDITTGKTYGQRKISSMKTLPPVLKIKLAPGAKLPTRAHTADAGLDIYCPGGQGQIIPAKESAVIDTGVCVQIPEGFVGFLKSKSGLYIRHGISSGEGVIDSGYTGSIAVKLNNNSGYDYKIADGDKISQLVLLPIITPEIELVNELDNSERGDNGFGSTGK